MQPAPISFAICGLHKFRNLLIKNVNKMMMMMMMMMMISHYTGRTPQRTFSSKISVSEVRVFLEKGVKKTRHAYTENIIPLVKSDRKRT